jgi:hypothetical protein
MQHINLVNIDENELEIISKTNGWLTDSIVNVMIGFLALTARAEAVQKCVFFNSFWYTKVSRCNADKCTYLSEYSCKEHGEKARRWTLGEDIYACNFIFIPINIIDSSSHRSLVILVDAFVAGKAKMIYLDSLTTRTPPSAIHDTMQCFVNDATQMRSLQPVTLSVFSPVVHIQHDGHSCGWFMLKNVAASLSHLSELQACEANSDFRHWYRRTDGQAMRPMVLRLLLNIRAHTGCESARTRLCVLNKETILKAAKGTLRHTLMRDRCSKCFHAIKDGDRKETCHGIYCEHARITNALFHKQCRGHRRKDDNSELWLCTDCIAEKDRDDYEEDGESTNKAPSCVICEEDATDVHPTVQCHGREWRGPLGYDHSHRCTFVAHPSCLKKAPLDDPFFCPLCERDFACDEQRKFLVQFIRNQSTTPPSTSVSWPFRHAQDDPNCSFASRLVPILPQEFTSPFPCCSSSFSLASWLTEFEGEENVDDEDKEKKEEEKEAKE